MSTIVIGAFTEMDCLFRANDHSLNIENQQQVPNM